MLLVVISGCGLLSDDPATLSLHLQGGFDGDHVLVELNGRTLYDSTAITNQITGFAGGVKSSVDRGLQTIRATVNGSFTAEEQIWLPDEINVGVGFSRREVGGVTRGVTITVSKKPFVYF